MRLGDLWPGASRREENHAAWEENDPHAAIRAKGRHAVDLGIRKQNRRKSQTRIQRNNRREY